MISRPAGSVDAESGRLRRHVPRRGEQHAARDAGLLADGGGLQRPRLGALGQHDAPVGQPGGGGQPAAEGGWAQPGHVTGGGQAGEPARVEPVGHRGHHGSGPFGVVDRHLGVDAAHQRRRLVAVLAGEQDGQPGGDRRLAQRPHPRVRPLPDGQQEAGEADPVHRGEADAEDHLVPVAGHDDQPALLEQRKDAGNGLGGDDDALHPPVLVTGVEHGDVQAGDDVAQPRPGQRLPVGDGRNERDAAHRKGRSQPLDGRRPCLGQPVHHRTHDAVVFTGTVGARCDRHGLGQVVHVVVGGCADEQDVGIERLREQQVDPTGIDQAGARYETLDDQHVVLVQQRLGGREHVLHQRVQGPVAEPPLHLLRRDGLRRPQRGREPDQSRGPVGHRPGRTRLGERLVEADVDGLLQQRLDQAEAGRRQPDSVPGGHDEHDARHWASSAVSRAMTSSSSVGTTRATTGESTLLTRPPKP